MVVAQRAAALLLGGFFTLSGCLSEGELADGPRPFDPIAAPVWEPGYTWNYKATVKQSGTEGREKSESSETENVIVRVLNTTQTVEGKPVYFLRVDGDRDTPFWSDELVAVTKLHLEEVAVGQTPGPNYGSYSSCTAPKGPYVRTAESEAFPGPRFPLDDGKTWTGRVSPGGDFFLDYTSTVLGLETIEVPAGRLNAVHIKTEFQAASEPQGSSVASELGQPLMKFAGDLWYSPEARYFAKAIVTATSTQLFPTIQSYTYEHLLELDTYVTTLKPEEPSPRVENGTRTNYALKIVSDTKFPVDVGEGKKFVRFGFEAAPGTSSSSSSDDMYRAMESYSPYYYEPPAIPKGDFGTPAYDHQKYEPRWSISGPSSAFKVYNADTFDGDLSEPGVYTISLKLRAKGCNYDYVGSATGRANVFAVKTYEVMADTGTQAGEKLITTVSNKYSPMNLTLSWAWVAADGSDPPLAQALDRSPVRDDGHPVVRTNAGTIVPGTGTGPTWFKLTGSPYSLFWKPEGGATGYGDSPVLFGHKAIVTARLDPVAQPYSSFCHDCIGY